MYSRLTTNSRTFSSPQKKNLYPLAVTPLPFPLPSPGSPNYILSPWIYQLWTYHMNGIYVMWPFMSKTSLLSMFSGFIHVVAFISLSFCLWLNNTLLYRCITFRLSVHPLMDIWVIFFLAVMNNAAMNICIQDLRWTFSFYFKDTFIKARHSVPRKGLEEKKLQERA